jgi:sulfur-oxidizing protein SoxY
VKRRRFLEFSGAGIVTVALPVAAQQLLPAHDLRPLIAAVTGAAAPRPGRIKMDLPQLAENGSSVPLEIKVDSPMTEADHVRSVHVFAERNPRPAVASFYFGASAGRAQLSARIRLAGTQRVVALAVMSDGSCWTDEKEVVVTSAACLDEMSL